MILSKNRIISSDATTTAAETTTITTTTTTATVSQIRVTAVCDFIARKFARGNIRNVGGGASYNSGKGGLLKMDVPSQHVLERACCHITNDGVGVDGVDGADIDQDKLMLHLRFQIALPARGEFVFYFEFLFCVCVCVCVCVCFAFILFFVVCLYFVYLLFVFLFVFSVVFSVVFVYLFLKGRVVLCSFSTCT